MHKRAIAALALLGLVILATLAIIVSQQEQPPPGPTPAPTTTEPPTPESAQTLLVQVRDPALLALGSVLMGMDPEQERLSQLWWSPEWWIDQVGAQEVSAADLGRKPVAFVQAAVQNQTEVPVNDAWVMDRLAFAGMVDAVGGVRLDLPARTAYLNEQGVPEILEAGPQDLAGAQAADYVLDPSLRNENVRLSRFQAVWDQILRRFPADQEKARTLVVSLGALSKATMTTDELADYLSRAKDLVVGGQVSQATVPLSADNFVRVRPPQGVRLAYAMNADRMRQRMQRVFVDYPALAEPVARIYAAAIRGEALETMREDLSATGWRSAWGGRTTQMTSGVIASPTVAEEQVVSLEEATGMIPATGELPWGQARVDVARTMEPGTSGGG